MWLISYLFKIYLIYIYEKLLIFVTYINKNTAVFFYILKKPETNVLESLSNEEFIEVRKGIIQCILATDMAKHSTLVNQFKNMTENFDFKNPEHRSMVYDHLIIYSKC